MARAGRRRTIVVLAAAIAALAAPPFSGSRPQDRTVDLSSVEGSVTYQTETPPGPAFLGSAAHVLDQAFAAVRKSPGASLKPDPRLAVLARWVRQHLGADNALPARSVLDVLARRIGLAEPAPHLLVMHAQEVPRLADVLAARLAETFDLRGYTHIGGIAEAEPGRVVVVIALSRRRFRMSPVPRSLSGPGRVRLEGRLLDGLSEPELTQSLPGGETRSQALGHGSSFRGVVALAVRGRHRLEIVGHGPEGPTVVANFSIFVGVPVDDVREAEAARADAAAGPVGKSPEDVRQRLLELINAERLAAGLGALIDAPDLDKIALEHSEDMRANAFVAHVSPTTGSLEDRLLKAGVLADLAAENVGRGYGTGEIHGGFMDSPGHRAAILHEDVTHVGVGVAAGTEDDRPVFLVTELFIRRVVPLGPDAKALLLAELDRRRDVMGLAALIEDPKLSATAGKTVREFLLNPALSQKTVMQRLQARVAKEVSGASSIYSVFMIVGTLEAGASKVIGDPRADKARRLGIGIAQGPLAGYVRSDLAPGSIVLVLIFAR